MQIVTIDAGHYHPPQLRDLLIDPHPDQSFIIYEVDKTDFEPLTRWISDTTSLKIPPVNTIRTIEQGQVYLIAKGEKFTFDGRLLSREAENRKPLEVALRESEERFRAIADNIPGVIYLCQNDETYSVIYLNDEVKNLTGYEPAAFLEKRISLVDLFHPDDKSYIFEQVDGALERREPFHITYRLKKGASWVWVDEYGQGIYERGKLKFIEGVLLDVTERKRVESGLREREANLKAIFESTNSLIGLFDTRKRLVEYNQAFAQYALRTSSLEVYQGMDLASKLKPEMARQFTAFQDRALKGEKITVTGEYPTQTGSLYFMSSHNPIYQDEKIIGVSLFVQDVTELKNSQKELERYTQDLERIVEERTQELKEKNEALQNGNNELEQALKDLRGTQAQLIQAEKMASLGVLAAGVGHEINNPLNFIKNGCSALLQQLQDEPDYKEEELKPFFDIINDGVDRASRIVKSLSHFSRQVKTMDEKCSIHDILDNCLVILNAQLKGRVHISRRFCKGPLTIKSNGGKLHQAFLNILANAEQAISDQGTVTITTEENENQVTVEIGDDGVGIPEGNLSRISDPFFTTKEPGSGTGLGLFITYAIIKELKGAIQVESEPKKGTKFKIVLPKV